MLTFLEHVPYVLIPLADGKTLHETVQSVRKLEYGSIFNQEHLDDCDRRKRKSDCIEEEGTKRLMAELTVSSMPVQLKKMKAKLEKIAKTFNEDFAVDEMVVLWSKKGCEAQKIHTDNVITKSGNVIYVISGVIALENGTKVVFDLGKKKKEVVEIAKGTCILFRSTQPHGGAAYQKSNHRIHFVLKDKNEKLSEGVVNRVWNCTYDNCARHFFKRKEYNKHLRVCKKGRKETEAARKKKSDKKQVDRLLKKEKDQAAKK